jgi:hypothetical protein
VILDLSWFDAIRTQFDLVVDSPCVLDVAAVKPTCQVTRLVDPLVNPFTLVIGQVECSKDGSGFLGKIQIASCQCRPTNVQVACFSHAKRLIVLIKDNGGIPWQRFADRHTFAIPNWQVG